MTVMTSFCLIIISAVASYLSNKTSLTQLVEYPNYIGYLFRLLALNQIQHLVVIIIYYRKNLKLRKAVIEQICTFWKTWIARSN